MGAARRRRTSVTGVRREAAVSRRWRAWCPAVYTVAMAAVVRAAPMPVSSRAASTDGDRPWRRAALPGGRGVAQSSMARGRPGPARRGPRLRGLLAVRDASARARPGRAARSRAAAPTTPRRRGRCPPPRTGTCARGRVAALGSASAARVGDSGDAGSRRALVQRATRVTRPATAGPARLRSSPTGCSRRCAALTESARRLTYCRRRRPRATTGRPARTRGQKVPESPPPTRSSSPDLQQVAPVLPSDHPARLGGNSELGVARGSGEVAQAAGGAPVRSAPAAEPRPRPSGPRTSAVAAAAARGALAGVDGSASRTAAQTRREGAGGAAGNDGVRDVSVNRAPPAASCVTRVTMDPPPAPPLVPRGEGEKHGSGLEEGAVPGARPSARRLRPPPKTLAEVGYRFG